MDPARAICAGCGRTLAEITAWSAMDDTARLEVMRALPERLRGDAFLMTAAARPSIRKP